jgi:glycosyltransferase involved in cell wall biosynthesis
MKIAIYNSFIGKQYAESELIRRMCLAAQNLGWEAIEVGTPEAIKQFNPDFVLATHFSTPKLSEFPTYGCMWGPLVFLDQYEAFIEDMKDYIKSKRDMMKYANIFSYDAYLSSSQKVDNWVNKNLTNTAKQFFIAPFFTSCNQTEYQAPNLQNPHLVYIGSNWDGSRFKRLFKGLDARDFMEVYGSNWGYLKKAYKGTLPFDGTSVLNTLRAAGVGLCLHKQEHTDAETPSMRIFEIVASGALAICGEHKFIRDAFGDSVFYVDINVSIPQQIQQISKHIDWIKTHHQEALEMSKKAHDIFSAKYSLEKLLLGIVPYHESLIKQKGFIKTISDAPQKQVEFIVRVGDRSLNTIQRCLDSIVNQTYKNIAVILVKSKEIEGLSDLIQKYTQLIKIKTVNSESTGFRSTQLKDGIKAITADYFGILDDDDLIYPNHAYLLISLLEKYKFAGVAYSGAIKACEDSHSETSTIKDLVYFEDFDLKKIAEFKNFITSNSFVAKSALASDIYKQDLQLQNLQLIDTEDFFLILRLCQKSIFIFSYEATCEFYNQINVKDDVEFKHKTITDLDTEKSDRTKQSLLEIFKDQDFLSVIKSQNNLYLHKDIKTKNVKFSNLKYTNYEKLLKVVKHINSSSASRVLRIIYVKLSKGGNINKNPNLFNKFLIYVRNLIYN